MMTIIQTNYAINYKVIKVAIKRLQALYYSQCVFLVLIMFLTVQIITISITYEHKNK